MVAGMPSTLVELLRERAASHRGVRAYTFLDDSLRETATLTFDQLDQRARAIAALLQSHHAAGSPVLLIYPPGLEFVAAFFGCLYAGALAVPAYPPRPNQFGERLHAILRETRAKIALTTGAVLSKISAADFASAGALTVVPTDIADVQAASQWRDPGVDPDTIAFLQFTSGSTLAPKGVMVTHGNLMANEAMIQVAFEQTAQSSVFGWLPLYHDMGLIGNVLHPLYVGVPCVLMSPVDFLLRPYRWLAGITKYKATTSGAPDFAYELCVRKITPEQRATLDLSNWDLAYNGAEPVRPRTIDAFSETFAPCGFRREAFYPCYGLAEATLFVTGGRKKALPVIERIQDPSSNDVRDVVGCGETRLGLRIAVVDPETLCECPAGTLGEIWVSGPTVARGYWNRIEDTEQTFNAFIRDTGQGPFLRTGDLGVLEGGELFVRGRIKDTIIVHGVNHYPHDIEATVERSSEVLRPRSGAAFAVDIGGRERVIAVHEVERDYRKFDLHEVAADIRQSVAERHGLQLHAVLLIKAGTIPRTSSGKIQRLKCRSQFLQNDLDVLAELRSEHRNDVILSA